MRLVSAEPIRALQPAPPTARPAGKSPPPLHSMRVPKALRSEDDDADREWTLRAAEAKARVEAAEQREWLAQLARAKEALRVTEEQEWRALRERASTTSVDAVHAEEREWQERLTRARSLTPGAAALPAQRPRPPRVKPAPVLARRVAVPAPGAVVLWP